MIRRPNAMLAALVADETGGPMMEFALIAPTFLILVLGACNVTQMVYGKTLLNGAMETAARASALTGATTDTLDATVKGIVKPALPGATFTFTRKSYYDFTDIGRKEKWTDANNNGTCDNKETYVDENGNGKWDTDVGESGNGGAGDVITYTVSVVYTPVFKVPFMSNQWNAVTLNSSTVRKNQPFSTQSAYGATTGTC